jgi:hypothetical protein
MTYHLIRALRRAIRDAYRAHFERSDRPFRVDLRRLAALEVKDDG